MGVSILATDHTDVDGSTNDTLNQAIKNALVTAGWSLIKSGSATASAPALAPRRRHAGDIWMWRGTGSPAPSYFAASSSLAHQRQGCRSRTV